MKIGLFLVAFLLLILGLSSLDNNQGRSVMPRSRPSIQYTAPPTARTASSPASLGVTLAYAASGCLTKELYEKLTEELIYVNKTKDTARTARFYLGGLCKRFPMGTRVYVLDRSGIFSVAAKVRYLDRSSEPDRWMSDDALGR